MLSVGNLVLLDWTWTVVTSGATATAKSMDDKYQSEEEAFENQEIGCL